MRFVALAGPDGEGGRAAWGSEADALEDVALSQFVLDFIIVPFCAFSLVGTPTIGRAKLIWYKLKQYNSFGTNLGSTPWVRILAPAPFCLVLSGAAHYWLFRLRNPLSSTPKLFNPPWPSQNWAQK